MPEQLANWQLLHPLQPCLRNETVTVSDDLWNKLKGQEVKSKGRKVKKSNEGQ
jgi:hypothetical protein